MHVRIVESGHDQFVAGVNDLSIGTDKRLHLVGRAHSHDLAAANCNASGVRLKFLGSKQRRLLRTISAGTTASMATHHP